ncbi:MAG: TolC family protein [Hydrogenovibrio sp.]|nr:TolC family protein [Hydrogenovibrio sp.]
MQHNSFARKCQSRLITFLSGVAALVMFATSMQAIAADGPGAAEKDKPQQAGAPAPEGAQTVKAVSQVALPEPLTLESLMTLPDTVNPQVLMSQAKQAQAQADYHLEEASDAVQLDVMGRLGWREYANENQDNHLLALHVGKQLYDFGKTESAKEAKLYLSQAQSDLYKDQVSQFQLSLMQGFFNVILADLQYRVDNEDMAVVYVSLDKAKDRHELKRISDVEYLKLQSDYEKILVKRTRSAYEQRRTREALANLVGQPQNLPDKLKFPGLKQIAKRDLKPLATYQQAALANNLQLQALKSKLEAAKSQMESQSADDKPVIRADAWAGKLSSYEYLREGRWRFDLTMDVPLYDGGIQSAKMSRSRAELLQAQADVKAMEQSLRDQVADIYFKLQLTQAEKKQNSVFGNYADLYLDYSRALYENEATTDLGDAMVRLSEATLQTVSTQFKQALYWAKLDYLTGQSVKLDAYQ